MPKPQILSDKELRQLTESFQQSDYSKDLALELVASATISMVTEPGDRMAGALARHLGKLVLLDLLVDGLQTRAVISELAKANSTDLMRQSFGDLESTLSDSRQRWLPRTSKSRLMHLFDQSRALELKLLTPAHQLWPAGLDDLQDSAPAMLFISGEGAKLQNLAAGVSIVGSRACSSYGKQVTNSLVQQLAAVSRPTVSGGAVGIDAHAHQASVDLGLPTIAVMAGGLDKKYPRANFPLFQKIKANGALVSELPPGVAPTRWRFLQRNRLIAALTPTTVVIEAGVRSGSIRTANNALELDRQLFAVPGSVLSSTSAGTNALIADGRAEALNDLQFFASGRESELPAVRESALAKRARDAIREIGYPTRVEIAKGAGLTTAELSLALLELTTQNHVIEDRNNKGEVHYALKYAH
jgi:DNA processing protein